MNTPVKKSIKVSKNLLGPEILSSNREYKTQKRKNMKKISKKE